jgi:hypothetical protein
MKKLYFLLLLFTVVLVSSCSKEKETPVPEEIKELPDEIIPPLGFTVVKDGDKTTLNLTGKIVKIDFYQTPTSGYTQHTSYSLQYDKLLITSSGKQPFTFARTDPYTYIITYTPFFQHELTSIHVWAVDDSFLRLSL